MADRAKTRGSLNVRVSGFSRQSAVSIDAVVATIDTLPAFHLVGLNEIVYDPHRETASAVALQRNGYSAKSKGAFMRESREVLVFAFDGLPQLQHILYHEIGHHVFDRVLASPLRKQWTTLINPHSRHVSDYAARNTLEDFAECYATFVLDPKKLQDITTKYVFLRDHVFNGVAYNLEQGHLDMSF
jgi:hypothetical protein